VKGKRPKKIKVKSWNVNKPVYPELRSYVDSLKAKWSDFRQIAPPLR